MTAFAGTAALARIALRRDRVMLPVWIAVFVLVAASSASATAGLYPTVASRIAAASAINGTASLVALYGKVYDPTSLGAVALIKLIALGSALVAVLAIVTVVRHTRGEEESGRLELIGSTEVGRHAALTAALVVTWGACVALGALGALALIGSGLPVAGSLAFGAAWAACGVAFAAVAAVAAQLVVTARAAVGLASVVLGAGYLARAVGDSSGPRGPRWLSWLSPIGWSQQIRPFAGDRWSMVTLSLLFAATMTALAYVLVARRDLGAGLFPDRTGRPGAGRALEGPLGLAWRLQRASLLGWTVAFAGLGAVCGNIASNLGSLLDSPQAKDMVRRLGGQQDLTNAFLAAELGIMGLLASAYGVQVVLRLQGEEVAGRAELLLATRVSRVRWIAAQVVLAVVGPSVLLGAAGTAAGITSGTHTGHIGAQVRSLLGAASAQLPAVWVIVAVTSAAFGLAQRFAVAGWVAVVTCVLLGELGALLRLDHWIMDISPFTHVPKLPGAATSATPFLALAAVAAGLFVGGGLALRRRDLG